MTKVLLYIPLLVGLLLFPALGLVDFQARVNACERRDFLANIRALAEQGNALAQNSLGGKYATGQGVSQDYVFAHMWSNLAASQGNEDAVKQCDEIATKMTPDQIAKAQRLAREWMPKEE